MTKDEQLNNFTHLFRVSEWALSTHAALLLLVKDLKVEAPKCRMSEQGPQLVDQQILEQFSGVRHISDPHCTLTRIRAQSFVL